MNTLPDIFPKDKLSTEELVLLNEFYKEYYQKELKGSSQWIMLCYASFTSVFTVDYLYRLWMNLGQIKIFDKNAHRDAFIDQIAISDLLNSNLVKIVNKGIYSIPTNIRWASIQYLHHLTTQTDNPNQLASIKEIAHFLEKYIQELQNDKSPLAHLISKEYEWTSLVYKTPDEALERIGDRFESALMNDDKVNNLNLVNALNLSEQFIQHHELLGETEGNGKSLKLLKSYSDAWRSYMYKDDKIAEEQFKALVPYFKENISSKFYAPSIITQKVNTKSTEKDSQIDEKRIMIIVWKWSNLSDYRIDDKYLEKNKRNFSKNISEGEDKFFNIYPVQNSNRTKNACVVATSIYYEKKSKDILINLINHIYNLYKKDNPKIFLFLNRGFLYDDNSIETILKTSGNIIDKAFLFSGGTDYIYYGSHKEGFLDSVGHFANGRYRFELKTEKIITTNRIVFNSKETEELKQPYFDRVWEYYSYYFAEKIRALGTSLLSEIVKFNQEPKNASLIEHLKETDKRLDLRIKSLLGSLDDENNLKDLELLEELERRYQNSYLFEDFLSNISNPRNNKEKKISKTYEEFKELLQTTVDEKTENIDLDVMKDINNSFDNLINQLQMVDKDAKYNILVLAKSPLDGLKSLNNNDINVQIIEKDFFLYLEKNTAIDLIIYDFYLDELKIKKKLEQEYLELRKKTTLPIIVISDSKIDSDMFFFLKNKAKDYLIKSDFNIYEWRKKIIETIQLEELVDRGDKTSVKKEDNVISKTKNIFIAKSPQIQEIKRTLEKISEFPDVNILITGETGVGKEVAAHYLHEYGVRKNKPFVTVNLAAIPEELLVSSLFGHVKNAFLETTNEHIGYAEEANGGILFLDEIGEISHEVQTKILRFIIDKTFRRLGSNKDIKVNIQILSATNRNLEEEVRLGRFREDLYYHLNGYKIEIPALRDRKEDIIPLTKHFISKKQSEKLENINLDDFFEKEVQSLLLRYDWKGNVRELRNTIDSILIKMHILDLGKATLECLPTNIKKIKTKINEKNLENSFVLELKKLINSNLDNRGLNAEMLAKKMNMSRMQLHRKTKALTSQTVSEIILEIRLEKAIILLEKGEYNISEIAYLTGFSSPKIFSRHFKKYYGLAPSNYKI